MQFFRHRSTTTSHFHNILTFTFLLLLLPELSSGEVCDFSHLTQEIPLLSDYTVDVTEKAKSAPSTWKIFERTFPNTKRVFASSNPPFIVILGWAQSRDNFDKFTRDQVEANLTQMASIGKSRAEKQGQDYQKLISSNDPLTLYFTVTYVDEGTPFKDIGMDVVATPSCIVSLMISGRTGNLKPEHWKMFNEQFELVRKAIKDKYGVVNFPSSGSRVSWYILINKLTMLLISVVLAFIVSTIFRIKFILQPCLTFRIYSIFIMVLSLVMVVMITLFNEVARGYRGWEYLTHDIRYETIPYFILTFFIYLWAYVTKKPKVIAFALWLIAISICVQIAYWLLDWYVINGAGWMAILIGFGFAIYTLNKCSSLKSKVGKSEEIEPPKILACPHCGAEYNLTDYRQNVPEWFCPQCQKAVPKE